MDYVFSLGIPESMELILTAMEQSAEEKIMFRWVAGGYERVMSFAEFKERMGLEPEETRTVHAAWTKDEILADVRDILNGIRGVGGGDSNRNI